MSDKEILMDYVKIAPLDDLRALALEYAVALEYEELAIVTKEIKSRHEQDRQLTKATMNGGNGGKNESGRKG